MCTYFDVYTNQLPVNFVEENIADSTQREEIYRVSLNDEFEIVVGLIAFLLTSKPKSHAVCDSPVNETIKRHRP